MLSDLIIDMTAEGGSGAGAKQPAKSLKSPLMLFSDLLLDDQPGLADDGMRLSDVD